MIIIYDDLWLKCTTPVITIYLQSLPVSWLLNKALCSWMSKKIKSNDREINKDLQGGFDQDFSIVASSLTI